jgi:hypothetical protein
MSAQDYRINAEVRRLLVSRWIDVSRLQIGTTNGVVYLMGVLEASVEDALERSGQRIDSRDPVERLIRLVTLVEKELRRVRGVRDLVLRLRNVQKRGRAWNVVGAGSGHGAPQRGRREYTGGVDQVVRHDVTESAEEERTPDAKTPRRS